MEDIYPTTKKDMMSALEGFLASHGHPATIHAPDIMLMIFDEWLHRRQKFRIDDNPVAERQRHYVAEGFMGHRVLVGCENFDLR